MSEYTIRAVTDADVDVFHAFLLKAYAQDEALGIHYAAAHATRSDIEKHFAGNLCYILEQDGRILASASLRLPWGPNPGPRPYPHLGWFSTDPDVAGHGWGKKMLHWLEQEILIKQLKSPMLTLGTAQEHPWIVGMYERMGFVQFDTAVLGRGHTTVYMRKELHKE